MQPRSSFSNDDFHRFFSSVSKNDLPTFNALVQAGIDTNFRFEDDNSTVLHAASYGGCLEIVKILLEKNPSLINKKTTNDITALHLAARSPLSVTRLMISCF
jgi:ankyrin repeat protein